jgi:hypothetical protein
MNKHLNLDTFESDTTRIRLPKQFCAAALLGVAALTQISAQQYGRSDSPLTELARIAGVAGSPLQETARESQPPDFKATWDRLLRIYEYRDASVGNPVLARNWSQVEEKTLNCLSLLSVIAEIDHVKPSGWDIFAKTIRDNKTDNQKYDRDVTIWERILAEGSKLALQEKFRTMEADLYNSIGALKEAGESSARRRLSDSIDVEYLPSWRGTYRGDVLNMRNNSGVDLENASVAVTVYNGAGRSVTHIHTVDRWRSGAVESAWYPYFDGDYTTGRAFDDPAAVEVAVYSGDTVAGGRYRLSPDEWENLVRGYCSHLTFKGNFLGEYVEDGSGKRFSPGFQFSFTGLGSLPVTAVEVRFWSQDGRSRGVVWNGASALEASRYHAYRSDLFRSGDPAFGNGQLPAHVDVILEFAGTTYQHTSRIY